MGAWGHGSAGAEKRSMSLRGALGFMERRGNPGFLKSDGFHHPFVTHYWNVTHWRHGGKGKRLKTGGKADLLRRHSGPSETRTRNPA